MKRQTAFFCLLGALTGCGTVPPSGMTPQPDVVTTGGSDAAVSDSALPADASASETGATSDRPTAPDTGTDSGPIEVCRPTIRNDQSREMCVGAAMCAPNFVNPTCEGARACTCGANNAESQANLLCNTSLSCNPLLRECPQDQTCRAAVLGTMLSCEPGNVRCSVNLPRGVAYAPFRWSDNALLNWILQTPRQREQDVGMPGTAMFPLTCGDGNSRLGSVQMCTSCRIDGTPIDVSFAECVGQTCYWRRGIADQVVSAELVFANPCELELRVYRPGAMTPSFSETIVAYLCNPPSR